LLRRAAVLPLLPAIVPDVARVLLDVLHVLSTIFKESAL
jgi:hypothetical protein